MAEDPRFYILEQKIAKLEKEIRDLKQDISDLREVVDAIDAEVHRFRKGVNE